MIILNGTEHTSLSGDYIDLYKYHILECRSNLFGRFVLPGYLQNDNPSDDYPYEYMWVSYVYKDTSFTINNNTYQSITYTNENLKWKVFCIPR